MREEQTCLFDDNPEYDAFIDKLDAQSAHGKTIFGGGLLLSEKAAAEKAAAEKADAIIWQLSDRERAIVAKLGEKPEGEPWD